MDFKGYVLPSCIIVSCVVTITIACSCRPNLKAEACNSEFVIIAKVLEERQMMSQKGWVLHYSLRVTDVLKSSEEYEEAEKIMQTKLRGDGCGDQLQEGHAYIFAGHVGEFVDEGKPRKFLETQFCNYVDFKDLAVNEEVMEEITDMMQNPPSCIETRADVKKLDKFNNPQKSLDNFSKRKWNNPFSKRRWNNPFSKRRWNNPFLKKKWNNHFF